MSKVRHDDDALRCTPYSAVRVGAGYVLVYTALEEDEGKKLRVKMG